MQVFSQVRKNSLQRLMTETQKFMVIECMMSSTGSCLRTWILGDISNRKVCGLFKVDEKLTEMGHWGPILKAIWSGSG